MSAEIIDLPQLKSCHDVESDIRRNLLAAPGVTVSSLVVRRVPNGICLQGVIHYEDDSFDISSAVRELTGVRDVVNQMVECTDQLVESEDYIECAEFS